MTTGPESDWPPDADDLAFSVVYGDWDPLAPRELAVLMDGFPEPWWIVGGHAVEAFTGVRRFHEDIDLVVFADAVPALDRPPRLGRLTPTPYPGRRDE